MNGTTMVAQFEELADALKYFNTIYTKEVYNAASIVDAERKGRKIANYHWGRFPNGWEHVFWLCNTALSVWKALDFDGMEEEE